MNDWNPARQMPATSSTLGSIFRATVQKREDEVFIHDRGRDWSYAEVWRYSAAFAGWLQKGGLQEGDRVGLLVANSAEYVVCYLGTLLAGGVVVALNPDTTPRDLSHTLVHCEPSIVVTAARCEKHISDVSSQLTRVRTLVRLADDATAPATVGKYTITLDETLQHDPIDWVRIHTNPNAIAQIIYTSGTTGKPKGVTLRHHNLVSNTLSIVQYLNLTSNDSVFVILPFFYSYGNSLMLTHMAVGGRVILSTDFVFWNRALELMRDQRATGFSGVPSTYAMLLHKSKFESLEFPDLRYLTCAGGALAPSSVRRVMHCLPHVDIFLMYGQTEASARLSTLMPHELPDKLGSIGRGIPGVELRVLDEDGFPVSVGDVGEIYANGDNVMAGYWNDESSTNQVVTELGLKTGDMARVDDDGYIFVVGRRNDMIKSGAFRINPEEIEEAIYEVPGIAEVAVVGQKDSIQGELIVAFVVPQSNCGLCEQEVMDLVNGNLPRHKQVKQVYFVDALPRTPSGKIRRSVLQHDVQKSDA